MKSLTLFLLAVSLLHAVYCASIISKLVERGLEEAETEDCGFSCGHGLCDPKTNKCMCFYGWTGSFCNQVTCSLSCNNGQCDVNQNKCICDYGWEGKFCNEGRSSWTPTDNAAQTMCMASWCGHPGGIEGWFKDQRRGQKDLDDMHKLFSGPSSSPPTDDAAWAPAMTPPPVMCMAAWCGHPGGFEGWLQGALARPRMMTHLGQGQ